MKHNISRRTFLTTAVCSGLTAGTASAGLFSTIRDAVKGHTDDIIERVTVADAYAPGNVQASNNFRIDDIGRDAAHWANGTVQLKRDHATGKRYIQLQDNFKAGPAPDLYIYVSKTETYIVDETSFNQHEQVELGKLSKGSGASFYEVPAGVTVNQVTIWCKRFGAFIASTNL